MPLYDRFAHIICAVLSGNNSILPSISELENLSNGQDISYGILELLPHLYALDSSWTQALMESLLRSSSWVWGLGCGMKGFSAYAGIDPDHTISINENLLSSQEINSQATATESLPGLCYVRPAYTREVLSRILDSRDEKLAFYTVHCLPCLAETDYEFYNHFVNVFTNRYSFNHVRIYTMEGAFPGAISDNFQRFHANRSNNIVSFWDTISGLPSNNGFDFLRVRWNAIFAQHYTAPQIAFNRTRYLLSNYEGLAHSSLSLFHFLNNPAIHTELFRRIIRDNSNQDCLTFQSLACISLRDIELANIIANENQLSFTGSALLQILARCIELVLNN